MAFEEIRSPTDNMLLARIDRDRALIEVAVRRRNPETQKRAMCREVIDLTRFYPGLSLVLPATAAEETQGESHG